MAIESLVRKKYVLTSEESDRFLLLSCFCHFDLFTLKNSDSRHNKG
jgi:hypothetical protein